MVGTLGTAVHEAVESFIAPFLKPPIILKRFTHDFVDFFFQFEQFFCEKDRLPQQLFVFDYDKSFLFYVLNHFIDYEYQRLGIMFERAIHVV